MNAPFAPVAIIIASNVIYHLSQRLTPARSNPAASLVVTYAVSIALSFALFALYPPEGGLAASFKELRWPSYLLGIGAAGIEVGFLLAYRSGWPIGTAALCTTAALTVALIPIGMLWFAERPTPVNAAGIVLALTGLFLMGR